MMWMDYIKENKGKIVYNALKWEYFKETGLYTSPEDMAQILELITSNQISWNNAGILFHAVEQNRKQHAKECFEFVENVNT